MMTTNKNTTILFILAFSLFACRKTTPAPSPQATGPSILQLVQNDFQFSLLDYSLKRTGLDSLLRTPGPFTLFAPNNNDFTMSGIASTAGIDSLDVNQLRDQLRYHLLPQKLYFLDIPQGIDYQYKTLLGDSLFLSTWDDPQGNNSILTVNGRYSVRNFNNNGSYDQVASNGVIHELDGKLLVPPTLTAKDDILQDTNYTCFVAALRQFGLLDQLGSTGPVTVFVPNNTAFLNNGIGLDSIARMDTLQYKKFLFGAYILNPDRMFQSDLGTLQSILGNANALNNLYTPDGIFTIQGQVFFFTVDQNGNQLPLGGNANFVNQDNLMLNGVVNEIDNLIVYPSNALK